MGAAPVLISATGWTVAPATHLAAVAPLALPVLRTRPRPSGRLAS